MLEDAFCIQVDVFDGLYWQEGMTLADKGERQPNERQLSTFKSNLNTFLIGTARSFVIEMPTMPRPLWVAVTVTRLTVTGRAGRLAAVT